MISLSIIIINYKTADLLLQCLNSIIKYENTHNYEFIIVDNNSNDNLEILLKNYVNIKYSFIQMGYNSGFSRANNAGMKISKGEYFLLLNSDTYLIFKNTINNVLQFLKTKTKKDVVAPILINEDLSLQPSARNWFFGLKDLLFGNSFFIYFTRAKKNYRKERHSLDLKAHAKKNSVLWFNGAFQMFHRNIFSKSKILYNEDFFLYAEDTEWAHRINKSGGKFYLNNISKIVHIGSASSKEFNEKKIKQVELSNLLFIRKCYGLLYFLIYSLFDIFNLAIDFLLQNKRNQKESSYNLTNKKSLYYQFFFTLLLNKKSDKMNLMYNVYANN